MTGETDFARPWGERLRTWRETVMQWSREEFVEQVIACAFRLNEERGQDLGVRLVGKWESGEIKKPQAMYRRILAEMNAPLPVPQGGFGHVLPSQADSNSRHDDGVDRRGFFQVTAATGLAVGTAPLGDALQRLERAVSGGNKADEATVADLEAHTQALFDAEERQSSGELISAAAGHLDNITTLLSTAPAEQLAGRLTVQAGTAAALAGWLAFDQGAFQVADQYYRTAEGIAEQAADPMLMACLRTYRSYLCDAQGKPAESARWLTEAEAVLPRGQQATMHTWIAARQAETALALGETDSALRALDRAYLVQDFGHSDEIAPPWTKFFTPTRLDGMAVASYARANRGEMDTVAERLLGGVGSGDTKVEQIALADLAYSYLERGDVERGAQLAQQALTAITRSQTRVGYERLDVVTLALSPYRGSRTVADLQQQLEELHRV